ncbi:AlkA N-terminal domain-containing protein [Paraglaciecola sp.]|uniref:DNA-3-methyladenine glycosylase 2 family protein n=1 Tax=Paraglaciecola sp. TaxID=1920173 RepID=UPI003266682B
MQTSIYQQARITRDPRFDGVFFIAVKTTHIFCRPICPANLPHEKNVEYFQHAQQAMSQGYRPCLRCRPDSAPQSYAWKGVETTVHRAMKLLREHHDLTINDITLKLGISDRYLRQLFEKHLGLTPKQYQIFNRILFSKKLLHETAMDIETVAHASGFASSRRLQHNFKKITGLSPLQVRKKKINQNQYLSLKLHFRPPFNWHYIQAFLQKRAISGVEIVETNCYSRTFSIEGCKGWFAATYQPGKNYLLLEINLTKIEHLSLLLSNIERVFDLNADILQIQKQLIKSGIPKNRITDGIRLPGVWDTFEAGLRGILGQQISVKGAISLLSLLTQTLGEKVADKYYFPTPQAIIDSNLEFLKIPMSRKQTIRDFCEYYSCHPNHSPDEWIKIKGIGPWTIAYAKMRGLSEPNIWLQTDLIIKKQLDKYKIDSALSSPWRSYLTFQLWNMA